MQGAVLLDDGTAVDAYDLPIWESLANRAHRLLVEVGLVIGGNQYRSVDDEVVGIGGRQSLTSHL